MAPTDKAVNRNQDKRTQSTPMPFEVQQLPPQPLPVVAQAMGVKMTEQARVHHPNDASLLPLMPIDFGESEHATPITMQGYCNIVSSCTNSSAAHV